VESAVACIHLWAREYVAISFHLDVVRARVMMALVKRLL
jgi:hypothetical protein